MQQSWSYILSMIASTTTLWAATTSVLPGSAIAQQAQPAPLTQTTFAASAAPPAASTTQPLSVKAVTFRQTPTGLCPAELTDRINQIVSSPALRGARWGILVASSATDAPLYSLNADDFLIPASNNKLLTTAAALQRYTNAGLGNYDTLKYWMTEIETWSDNDYADSLLNKIGGPAAAREALSQLGIDPSTFQQVDGSGLSRSNRVKPRTLVSLLQTMQVSDTTGLFYDTLPIAGVTGTLRNRFHNTAVAGRLRAKTGTLNGVRALSGYLDTNDYGPLVLSIIVNQPGQYGDVLVGAIDKIVVQVARLTACY